MELPDFLGRIEDGDLIITPGDRPDIILGSLLSHPSTSCPKISALLLTGGLEPAEPVQQLVRGLGNPPVEKNRRPPQTRRFEKEIPNSLWQIDIFTFNLKRMYPVYLVGMIDDHSRYMVGHGLFRQQTAQAVLEVVKGAIGQWGAPREILSDNGRQFAAWRGETQFQKVLKRQGGEHVRSAPHHPMTLGKIERFWKSIQSEFLMRAQFASFEERGDHFRTLVKELHHG